MDGVPVACGRPTSALDPANGHRRRHLLRSRCRSRRLREAALERVVVVPRATATSAAGCAMAALVKAVEAVQGAAAGGAAEAARGAGGAVAWVFSKVHLQSPDLAVGLLGMVACSLGSIVEAERGGIAAEAADHHHPDGGGDGDDAAAEEPAAVDDMPELVEADVEKEMWSQIGILHGGGLFGDSYGEEELDEEEIKEFDGARGHLHLRYCR